MTQPETWHGEESTALYDEIGDLSARLLGDNIHCGYWTGPADASSVQQATDRLTDMLVDRLGVAAGERVLDVGCGSGRPAVRLARARQVDVVGITISRRHLEQATARARAEALDGRVRFEIADVTALPYASASFDAAWAIESITLVPDRGRAFEEIARVLRPGRRLVEAGMLLRRPPADAGRRFLDEFCEMFKRPPFATMDGYRELAANAGLEVEELVDATDHVMRRTFAAIAPELAGAPELRRLGIGAELAAPMAAAMMRFVGMPEAGYGILVARRPSASPG